MTVPVRIQRQRTKGWRMPEGAVYVGRPSRWGNPVQLPKSFSATLMQRSRAVDWFRDRWVPTMPPGWLDPLRDATALACWCPLTAPCHADVLIDLLAGRASR